jgi:hypothetical protein
MVSFKHVEEQLKRVGCNFTFWGQAEVRELANVLMPEETIAQCVNGTYENGFAMLCVTQYRVLLVDRKPMLLTLEEISYDMIAEVDYHTRLLNSTIRIFTPMRNLVFTSWSQHRLRKCVDYIQQRVMELRQHGMGVTAQQFQGPRAPGRFAPETQATSAAPAPLPMNPYTKVPMFSKRRRFPGYY